METMTHTCSVACPCVVIEQILLIYGSNAVCKTLASILKVKVLRPVCGWTEEASRPITHGFTTVAPAVAMRCAHRLKQQTCDPGPQPEKANQTRDK